MGLRLRTPLVHKFKEWVQLPDLTCAAGAVQGGVLSPSIDLLTNWASYRALFDVFKVVGIKFKFLPQFNTAYVSNGLAPGASQGTLPFMYMETSHDPWAPVPVSVADILNTDGLSIKRLERPFNRYVKAPVPVLSWTDASGVVSEQTTINNNTAANRQWLSTGGNNQKIDQSASPHYGIRYLLDNQYNTSYSLQFRVFACFYFIMKEQD